MPQSTSLSSNKLPASFIYNAQQDPAKGFSGAPPNFGQPVLDHIHTVNGRYGLVSHSYLNIDEALNDSRANAYRMRSDCGIMESLEARQRAVALLNWSIEPEDTNSMEQVELAKQMTDILQATPRFTEMRRSLLEATWFGRQATAATFHGDTIKGQRRTVVKNWQPRNGDKLKFRYDDGTQQYMEGQLGIFVGTAYASPRTFVDPRTNQYMTKVQPTEDGLVYWFDKWERDTVTLHRHMVEDAPYWEPRFAGRIYGVGIRDRIYWTWYAMVECLQRVVEYLDRAAFGIEVWPYPAGNARAKEAASEAAKSAMGGGRTVILAPLPQGEDADLYLPKLVEPGLGGVNTTIDIIRTYFGHKIKRYILGQTLSSEAEATGMGSGVADAHLATLADIVRYDSVNLEESITTDFLKPLQLWNFPASDHIKLYFRIATEDPDAAGKMASFRQAWDMGLKLKASEVADVVGASMPDSDDEVLENPAMQQPMGAIDPMTGMPMEVPQDGDGDGFVNDNGPGERPEGMPAGVMQDPNSGGQVLDIGTAIDAGTANGSAMEHARQKLHQNVFGHLASRGVVLN